MKRSRTLLLFSLIGAFAMAAVASLASIATHVADTVYTSCRAFKNMLVDNFMALAVTEPTATKTTGYPQAKAFKARIEKRERPVLINSWRMCPSI